MASADRLIEIFNEAKARPAGAEREQFLANACLGDPELKGQVLSLLKAHTGAGDFLKDTLVISPMALITEKPGDTIGRYKLRETLGEGGCGVVYVAEQEEPVRRRVALKVIKLGMDTKAVVARFEAERQALAMMDHPNIARVLDAGTTDTGRPYFVMELVRGIKITDYCDQAKLSTKERLDLFIKVCHAIQHAHQKGIIHRDIKPSNILVTLHDGVPVPKVIDFGIAKATEGRLTDATVYTQLHQFIGTPAYMSPEQAEMSGLDIDTRSDIYSLGVLLYELLTGKTPFDANELMSQGIDVMRKTIREKEPIRPSTRLTLEWQRRGSARVSRAEAGVAPDSRLIIPSARETSRPNEGFGGTPQPARETRALPEHLRSLINALRGDLDWVETWTTACRRRWAPAILGQVRPFFAPHHLPSRTSVPSDALIAIRMPREWKPGPTSVWVGRLRPWISCSRRKFPNCGASIKRFTSTTRPGPRAGRGMDSSTTGSRPDWLKPKAGRALSVSRTTPRSSTTSLPSCFASTPGRLPLWVTPAR